MEMQSADDQFWSENELQIAQYLRIAGLSVRPGGTNPNGRHYDFTLNDDDHADGKTLDPDTNSSTMRNRARESAKDGGQARWLVFDSRNSGMDETEARRGVHRISGLYGSSGRHGHRFDRIIVIGSDFYLEEEV